MKPLTLAHIRSHIGEFPANYPHIVAHDNSHSCNRWRVNGKLRVWKRDADRFELPVKHGLYYYGTITNHNVDSYHCECECPYA